MMAIARLLAGSARASTLLASAVLAIAMLPGCAHDGIVPAAGRYTFGAVVFAQPPGADWLQLARSSEHVVFGRREPVRDGTRGGARANAIDAEAGAIDLTAWMKMIRTGRSVPSYAALHTIVVRMTDQLDRERFTLHAHVVEPVDRADAMCIRRSIHLDDLRAASRGAHTGRVMAMRMVDVLCRDPADPETIYSLHVSERAVSLPAIDLSARLAEQWLGALRFTVDTERTP